MLENTKIEKIENINKLLDQLNSIILGKKEILNKIVSCIIAGGNILLEDLPGVGKTVLSKAISYSIGYDYERMVTFTRIQGTPDLLPYDITGVEIYNPERNLFEFHKGPVFTEILLADELNRTTPKVQSALLEAMAERQVTSNGKTYKLSDFFFVIATQNPIESEGTYPLPLAQLDRFSAMFKLGYPDKTTEVEILKKGKSENRLSSLKPVITIDEIMNIRKNLININFSDKLYEVLTNVSYKTRNMKEFQNGLSTRALQAMVDVSRAYAMLANRNYVTDQDIIDLAVDIFSHRLISVSPNISVAEEIDRIVREEIRKVVF